MHYTYFIENTTKNYIDNTELFRLINDLQIDESEIYIDNETNKEELASLLRVLKKRRQTSYKVSCGPIRRCKRVIRNLKDITG